MHPRRSTLVSFILLSAFMLQSFSSAVIFVHYQLNKEYITQKYCINKAKPKMHCNGKCYMAKQMKEEEKRENAPVNTMKVKYEVQLFSQKHESCRLFQPMTAFKYNSSYHTAEPQPHLLAVFHPPTC